MRRRDALEVEWKFHRIGNAIDGHLSWRRSGVRESQRLTFKARRKSGDKDRAVAACLLVTSSTTSQSPGWSLVSGTQNRDPDHSWLSRARETSR
jgi:hypothetical protein